MKYAICFSQLIFVYYVPQTYKSFIFDAQEYYYAS